MTFLAVFAFKIDLSRLALNLAPCGHAADIALNRDM